MKDFHIDWTARPGDKVIDWRCTYTKSKCKGRLRTDDTESVVIHTKSEHCHAADERVNQKHILRDSVNNDLTQKPTDVGVLYG